MNIKNLKKQILKGEDSLTQFKQVGSPRTGHWKVSKI